jgi:hypothetical protein
VISKELEIGKAAEHLVCSDLILQGYRAFLSDQGLPYDVVVDHQNTLIRVQVRSTTKLFKGPKHKTPVYRFQLRSGKGARRRLTSDKFDVLACVALDMRKIAYLSTLEFSSGKLLKSILEFRSKKHPLPSRTYSTGTVRVYSSAKMMEDYGDFKGVAGS